MAQLPIDINDNISAALARYSDLVRRICFIYLHNSADVDDVFQEVFLKLLQNNSRFESAEHDMKKHG